MINFLASYYEMVANITYGALYLKENSNTKHLPRYLSHIHNISTLHLKIKQLKEDKNLPMFDFNNVELEDIIIKDGFLYGDIEKAKIQAYNFISNFNNDVNLESLKKYELGLLVMNLYGKAKKSNLFMDNEPICEGEHKEEKALYKEFKVEPKVSKSKIGKKKREETITNKIVSQFSFFS